MSKNRVRTKRNNSRKPLLLSSLKPEEFNVRPGEEKTLLCQDCRSWHRIIGFTTLKVDEHVGTEHGHGRPEDRCPGSNQIVVVDIDVKAWQARQDRLLRDAVPAETRRAARQFHKPLGAPPVPVHRIAAPRPPERKVPRAAQWRRVESAVRRTDEQRLKARGVPLEVPDLTTDAVRQELARQS
ncbi:hypothetical protein [Streptomyces sp. NPDC021096]|uniref:hypothetical protein n=1 Tax=Streptomyces sp. NPDC021096 TaxID=3154792 RepID=UPI0033F98ED6